MNNLIIGGTSGLGLEIARTTANNGDNVIITGRHDPGVDFAEYKEFDLTERNLPARIGRFVTDLPPVHTLVYAAGFYQEGYIDDVSDADIDEMIDVGSRGLVFFTKKLLEKQDELDELVTITSTSQWTPRALEPVYNLAKAGVAHYSNGLSLDPRVHKTLVVGPSGMATPFWKDPSKDTSKMMHPTWVAEQINNLRKERVSYLFARVLGANGDLPQRVEVVESRPERPAAKHITEISDETIDYHLSELADAYRTYCSTLEAKTDDTTEEEALRPTGIVGDIESLFKQIQSADKMTPALRKRLKLFLSLPAERRLGAKYVEKDSYRWGGFRVKHTS